MELGITTFAERTPDARTGETISPYQRLRDLMEEIALADEVGLDVFGVGEHHRPDFVASSPAVILGAAAQRTKRIRLTSAVTVLSSDDPVRVFQDFATVDLLSGGRAEIIAGRGSFTESFPLFGYDLADYDILFAEKLDLLLRIRDGEHVTWSGQTRAALKNQAVYPRPVQERLPIWVGVGGTPQSFVRAGTLGLPLTIAIIGGQPAQFASLIALYREAGRRAGHDPSRLAVCINSHGFVGDTSVDAADTFFPPYAETMSRIGKERGWSGGGVTRASYDAGRGPHGALFVGSPQEVIDKILAQYQIFGHQRFLIQFSVGTLPHDKVMHAIELFGTQVAPVVRKETIGSPVAESAA